MFFALVMPIMDHPAPAHHDILDGVFVGSKDSRIEDMIADFSCHERQILVEYDEIGAMADLDPACFAAQRPRSARERLLENNRADGRILRLLDECSLPMQ